MPVVFFQGFLRVNGRHAMVLRVIQHARGALSSDSVLTVLNTSLMGIPVNHRT